MYNELENNIKLRGSLSGWYLDLWWPQQYKTEGYLSGWYLDPRSTALEGAANHYTTDAVK